MPRPKIPCWPECSERSAECHATCKKWAEYEAIKFQDYDRRQKIWKEKVEITDYLKDTRKRMKRGKRKSET